MWRRSSVFLLLLGALCAGAQADPVFYPGILLSEDGGITGTAGNPWLTGGCSLLWTVTGNSNGTYTYEYRLDVPDASEKIHHWIIEVSPTFTADNVLQVQLGKLASHQPDDYPQAPDMDLPDTMHGLKFTDGFGPSAYDWTVSFVSDRPPTWGDFYAKSDASGGSITAIWNAGFTCPDTDPAVAAQSGTVDCHILVPDTQVPAVPAPAAGLLAGLGIGLTGWLRRRRAL